MKFRPAPEVKEIADRLIPEHHPHLLGVRIEYLFRKSATVTNGVMILGTASVVSGRGAFLARSTVIDTDSGEVLSLDTDELVTPDKFFVIDIALDTWGYDDDDGHRIGLSDAQRVALVDHELCHCAVHEGNLKMRAHSIEEFSAIVRRHGLWKPDVEWFAEVIKGAKPLPFGTGTPEAGA